MAANVTIEHNGAGWIEIFKSAGMQSVVDQAGERIASEAGEHFHYSQGTNNQFTVAGFVASDKYSGAWQEAVNKVLTKAVHS
jgi:3'-phosphoadenosine 5'-phosphosulfate (PAPS) 3'-phosphatase